MGRKLEITFAGSSVKDLEEIKSWYVDQQLSDVVGDRLVKEIISCIETLVDYPESGRIVPEFGIVHLQEIIRSPFRIVYRLEEDRVRVLRIWRSERLLRLPER